MTKRRRYSQEFIKRELTRVKKERDFLREAAPSCKAVALRYQAIRHLKVTPSGHHEWAAHLPGPRAQENARLLMRIRL